MIAMEWKDRWKMIGGFFYNHSNQMIPQINLLRRRFTTGRFGVCPLKNYKKALYMLFGTIAKNAHILKTELHFGCRIYDFFQND